MKKPENPRVSSWLSKRWLAEFVTERYIFTENDNSNCYYSKFSGESMETRVSSRPSRKLDMLVEVARRELRKMEKPDYDLSRLKKLADVAAMVYDQEYGGSIKEEIFVKVPRKKRSLRRCVVTTRWATNTFLIKLRNPKNNTKKRRPINKVSKEEEEEIRSHKKSKPLTIQTKIPEWLVNVMAGEENAYDPKPIIAKIIYTSDLDEVQGRLSMPLKQVVSSDFLNEEETRIIHEQSVLKTHKEGVSVVLVDPRLNKHKVDLRKWKMSSGWNYVFVDGWNDVVDKNIFEKENNKFKVGNLFHVWSFRSGEAGQLCFALIPLN